LAAAVEGVAKSPRDPNLPENENDSGNFNNHFRFEFRKVVILG